MYVGESGSLVSHQGGLPGFPGLGGGMCGCLVGFMGWCLHKWFSR